MKNNSFFTKGKVICLLGSFCCMLWGSATPTIKIGYQLFEISQKNTASQILFAGIRFTLAGILVVIIGSLLNRKFLKPKVSLIPKIVIVSIFQTILQYFCFYIGLAHTTGVKTAIVCSTNVFVSMILATLLFRQEKLSMKKIIGCIIGFVGVVIINLAGNSNGFDFNFTFIGEGLIFSSVIAYSFSTILVKIYSKEENPLLISGYQFIFGGIVMTIGSLLFGGKITSFPKSGIGILFYLSLLSATAYSIWSTLLKHNPVSKVAIYGFMTPLFGVLLSAIFLSESKEAFGVNSLIALVLVSFGIIVVNFEWKKK